MSVLSALSLSRRPAAAFAVIGLYWGCFAAYVPEIKAGLGASDAEFGMLLLGSALGLVSAMWIAPRVDRILGARTMPVAAALFAVLWLVPGLVTAPVLFFFAMLGVGMASGLLDVVMNARVGDLEAASGRSLMNANHGMFSAAYAVSAVVAGLSREAGLPPVAVAGAYAVLVAGLVPFLALAPAVVAAPEGGRGRFPVVIVALCGLVVLSAFMSEATVEAWSALHVERTLGGGAAEGALGPAMLGLTMAVGRFGGQAVAERLREVTVIFWAALLSATGAVIAAWASVPVMAYLGFGILGLGVSVIGPMGLALVGRLVPAHLRTEAIARVAVIGFSGFFFAPVLMGLASEAWGLRVAFTGVAVLISCAVPLALVLGRAPSAATVRA